MKTRTNQPVEGFEEDLANELDKGTYNNAKPIYWHSLTLSRTTSSVLDFYVDFIIINNDETPFTLETFMAWINGHPSVEIKTVQGYISTYSSNLVSYFKLKGANALEFFTIKLADGSVQSDYYSITNAVVLSDNGVNKIN